MEAIFEKTKSEKSIRNVYLVAFSLLLLSYLTTLYTNRQLIKQADRAENTNRIINSLDEILGKVKDGETGVRGYIMTKDIQFLFPYYGSYKMADSLHYVLLGLTRDIPQQQERLKYLKKNIDRRFELLSFLLRSFDDNNRERTDSMKKLQPESIKVMDDIRSEIATIKRNETMQLSERNEKIQRMFKVINIITIISLTVGFSLLFFGFVTYMQVSKEKKVAVGAVKNYQDQLNNRIDELNKANTELIQMRSQEKFAATGRIARTIAHEVRNPLTNINLATDQLRNEIIQKDESTEYIFEMINRNCIRINQLISDLLNSTKFSELDYEKVSINDLIDEALKEAEDRIALTNVKVVKKYSTDICDISVDKTRIRIAFLNIIINALEAMEEKGQGILTLETKGEKDKCKIIISDNGIGLDDDMVSQLFEAYFTSKPKGNGLGLTNTQNIILNHKGNITVKSEKGVGTSFTITLDFAS